MTLDAGKTYELLKIHDVRPIDWDSGKRLPVDTCELPECVRCGRRHAVVWTLLERPGGGSLTVGSGCGPKLLAEGLLPGVDFPAVKAAEREARAETKRLMAAHVEERARELAEVARTALQGLTPPAATWTVDKLGRGGWETCWVGECFRCVTTADLERRPGEWGRIERADVERSVQRDWLRGVAERALFAAGCPHRAVTWVYHVAVDGEERYLRDAALHLLP